MATCRDCQQEMKTADGCTVTELTCQGRRYPTFPYGRDPGWPARMARCGDCGARRGHHHHLGCDVQRCPRCRRQLISCDCRFDEFADEYEDEYEAEYEDDDEWGGSDDGAAIIDLSARGRAAVTGETPRPRGLTPLEDAAGPSRGRHRGLVRAVGESALARGRTFDLDVVAACLDALERHLGVEGTPLTRPDVNGLFSAMRNWASLRDTRLPDRWVEDLWTTLTTLAAGCHLAPDSDPITVLLEPIGCYGRVGLDGEPLTGDDDVDFACQCYLPYDPTLPEGTGHLIVGRHDDGMPRLAVARLQPRSREVDPSDWLPWLALITRVDTEPGRPARHPPTFVGASPGDRHNPPLWFYRPTVDGSGHPPLSLDPDGRPHRVKPDRRFRIGYRWVPSPDGGIALTVTGFHEPLGPSDGW